MAYLSYSMLLGLLLLVTSVFSIQSEEKGPKCRKDKIYRVLADPQNSPGAIYFCSTFASLPAKTTTITATSPGTATSTVYSTYTPRITMWKREASPSSPPLDATPSRLDASPSLPPYVSEYPASRVYRACSCLNTPTTQTVTASTVFVTATKTLPALCNPTNFLEYRGADDPFENVDYRQTGAANEQECCLSCFDTKNCLRFQYRPNNAAAQQCEVQVGIEQTNPSDRQDICPLGVRSGSRLTAPLGAGLGAYFLNYGPCMESSPLYGFPPSK
ncbi:MAG: hypothetical protein M1816_007662 [Peltula sp. TS41687]|nr:MAG: hypothetical protein M1816_007662 [Peltula sp. TS41687]